MNTRKTRRVWPRDDADTLLGTMVDAELAARFGVSRQAVAERRVRLGVPAYRRQRGSQWSDVLDTLDTAHTIDELAAARGVKRQTAAKWVHDLRRAGRVVSLGDGLWVAA